MTGNYTHCADGSTPPCADGCDPISVGGTPTQTKPDTGGDPSAGGGAPVQVCARVPTGTQNAVKSAVQNQVNKLGGAGAGGTGGVVALLQQGQLAAKILSFTNNSLKAGSKFYNHEEDFLGLPEGTPMNYLQQAAYDTAARFGPAAGPQSNYLMYQYGPMQMYAVPGSGLLQSGVGGQLNPNLAGQFVYTVYDSATNEIVTSFAVSGTAGVVNAILSTISKELSMDTPGPYDPDLPNSCASA